MRNDLPTKEGILNAVKTLEGVIKTTNLDLNTGLSEEFGAKIYLKREDLQVVRSYKIRGAYNLISRLSAEEKKLGVVTSSAGNHGQGVALSCKLLEINGVVFMPVTTPKQKIKAVERLGGKWVKVELVGDTYDDAKSAASRYCKKHEIPFVPPFDAKYIIEGQGTVGYEILHQLKNHAPDFIFVPIGGGGLASGLITFFKGEFPETKIVGVEPAGAPAMDESIKKGKLVVLDSIDSFVDGAAVKQVGLLTFEICKPGLDDLILVPEGKICTKILQLYNRDAIVAEPAGALAIAALDFYKEKIKGKRVVCILSGGNNDIERMQEIKERSLLYEGLKHYFIIKFPQRSGALKQFVSKVLGPNDDITLFEYTKKNSKESGPALVGIELGKAEDYLGLVERMQKYGIDFTNVNNNPTLFNFLI
jgi:threonine dehydratase